MGQWKDLLLGPIEIPWAHEFNNLAATVSRVGTIPLSTELLRWTNRESDTWTIEDALRGTQIFGATGGGKTSGAGDKIARAFLSAGFGGLVLCVKEDEGETWERLCKETGRFSDLRRIRTDGALQFNFLDSEAKLGKQELVLNISALFAEVIAMVNRSSRSQQKDSFWTDVLMQMLNHTICLQSAAEGTVTVAGLTQIINSAVIAAQAEERSRTSGKGTRGHGDRTELRNLFIRAKERRGDDPEVELAIEYFTKDFANLAEKTRSIVVTTFTSMADSLMRPPLRTLLSEGTTLRPEDTFEGKIIVVDVPIHVYYRVGEIVNLVWKTAFKRACQRRAHLSKSRLPVFLWADEDHYLFDQVDVEFQTTARSSLCCTVCLSQNLQNKYAKAGERASVDALLGSLHNKIFHQNNEQATNEFASKAIGKVPLENKSTSKNHDGKKSETTSIQWDYDVPPRVFTNLRSGGSGHKFVVDGILHVPGKKFSNGRTWLKFEVKQRRGGA